MAPSSTLPSTSGAVHSSGPGRAVGRARRSAFTRRGDPSEALSWRRAVWTPPGRVNQSQSAEHHCCAGKLLIEGGHRAMTGFTTRNREDMRRTKCARTQSTTESMELGDHDHTNPADKPANLPLACFSRMRPPLSLDSVPLDTPPGERKAGVLHGARQLRPPLPCGLDVVLSGVLSAAG